MKVFAIALSLLLIVFSVGCAPKKVAGPMVSQEELDASNAIDRAEEAIALAESEGADVSEAKSLLDEAKDAFVSQDFPLAITKAKSAEESANAALAKIRAAREAALESAEEETSRIPRNSYTVGTWSRDRDCLWTIL